MMILLFHQLVHHYNYAMLRKDIFELLKTLKQNNNCVLIASYGCVGTGITLSNLCFGVLFESFKSDVLNMVALERGLGLSKLKDKYVVYDIIDCFDKSCSTKAIYRQGLEKIKIYEENKYNNRIINTKL